MQLKKWLKTLWSLKGDFALVDIECNYYIARFTNLDDHHHVMNQGPWMIGDNYLMVRRWVPNSVPDKAPIQHLMAWVQIPNISIEYFDNDFLRTIVEKISNVVGIDSTIANAERGKFTRLSVELNLSKPLLYKFKHKNRVWKIQYEGLRILCFHCSEVGHKEDNCPDCQQKVTHDHNHTQSLNKLDEASVINKQNPKCREEFGAWMFVKKPQRKKAQKNSGKDDAHGHDPNLGQVNQGLEESIEQGRVAKNKAKKSNHPDSTSFNKAGTSGSRDLTPSAFQANIKLNQKQYGPNKVTHRPLDPRTAKIVPGSPLGPESQMNPRMTIPPLMLFEMLVTANRMICATKKDFLLTLRELIHKYDPKVLALVETKVSGAIVDNVCRKIGFRGAHRVEVVRFSRGFWVLWRDD
ncbi:hypothetical protein Cgig2_021306 [Carnegiea gigantea]|uniref:CCHC-type domain-containing protein n=1 Tax=Carnegiea gigantea TaxID=171969 RepID=A0A9Q1JJW6_9CARY|nr:hypothetical protein Cgig2_021306 [Carnegiea gigantea]